MSILLFLKSILIAVVEGITEFLPISSTGHMVLVGSIIGFNGDFEQTCMRYLFSLARLLP